MRASIVVAFAGLFLVGGLGIAEDPPKDDAKAVLGIWQVVEQTEAMQPWPIYQRVVFKGDKLTFHWKLGDQKGGVECTFKLDPKANPKQIDFTPNEGRSKGQTYQGLYQFEKDKLRICYRGPGSTRPKDFNDKRDGNRGTVFVVVARYL